jgi:DNA-binding NarL/FixJ family response regulator
MAVGQLKPGAGETPRPSEKHRLTVLLVDDHAMMREGLRSVLEAHSDIHIVGEAADGQEAIALVDELRPSLVVMDINMPRLNGIEATARIKARYAEIKVIGLSVNAGPNNKEAMLRAGADMLLTKEAAVEELYRSIQEVMPRI